jgi:hypothetical protein
MASESQRNDGIPGAVFVTDGPPAADTTYIGRAVAAAGSEQRVVLKVERSWRGACCRCVGSWNPLESTRVYLHLTNDWLAGEYQRAAGRIDAAAVAELVAAQEMAR